MCVRYLGFVLLVWFPGVLHAQIAAQPCRAPNLNGGNFVPERDSYSEGTTLTYSCDSGLKPAVEGWWASSKCQNSTWFPEPQCIDEKACTPLTIPNAGHTENSNGWFEEGHRIRITCDEGYELKNLDATAICINGTWSSVPVCEKSLYACGEPPKIPHAVIIGHRYQEVFAADSKVQYECEDGFTVEGADSKKSIFCMSGIWTEGPTCSSRPGTGHGGSAGGGHTTPAGGGKRRVSVRNCGNPPSVPYGVLRTEQWFLKYSCSTFYKLEGPETVFCYDDGTWSEVPTCAAVYCTVNTDENPDLVKVGVQYIKDGETMEFTCLDKWQFDNYSVGQCTEGRLTLSRCCNRFQIRTNSC